jgi:probable phosphoglycerate mutase
VTSALPVLSVPRLVLWRHGRTEWNATGRFQGQLDPPLDEEGRNQARLAAPHLVGAGLPPEETVVVSSDLSRAAETAETLTDLLGVPLRLDARLREHGMGCWEGLTRDEVAARYPEQLADWMAGRPVRGRGGENPADVAERALAALVDLPSARVAVVVTHGGTAGRLLERLLGIGPDHRRLFGALGNCAWSELSLQDQGWRLIRHNSSALQPPAAGSDTAGRTGGLRAVPSLRDDATPRDDSTPVTDADAVL